jgi:tripartite-type tricarboxylate transporter receptor subunit TctC
MRALVTHSNAIRALVIATALGAAQVSSAAQTADSFPSKPIRMIVAFAPGGGTDITARIAGRGITEYLGQPVVVDNRPGGGGIIGTELAARAPADGYTLITAGTGSHAINPALYRKIPYDPVRDFEPVCLVAATPYLMVVNPAVPAKTVKEFIALAKSKPGQINMGSSGSGGMPHLAGEMFQSMTATKLVHIPYKGTGAVFQDLMAGQVQVLFGDIVAVHPHVQGGRLRALGITSPKRSPSHPEVPAIAEAGVAGYDAVGWFGVFAPAHTPQPVIAKLNGAIVKYVSLPEIRERMASQGADVVASSPEQFAAVLKSDLVRWAKVVKDSGAHVE